MDLVSIDSRIDMSSISSIYLLTKFNEDGQVDSLAFLSKEKALKHITLNYSLYKPYAADRSEDIEFWIKSENDGLLLEKVNISQ